MIRDDRINRAVCWGAGAIVSVVLASCAGVGAKGDASPGPTSPAPAGSGNTDYGIAPEYETTPKPDYGIAPEYDEGVE